MQSELAGPQTVNEADWLVIGSQARLQPFLKRTLDIILATLLLLISTPLLVAIAIAIKSSTEGPVLYRQRRLKQGRQPFTLYKFRSMVKGADSMLDDVFHLNHASGPLFKAAKDPRVTRTGRFLRRTYLDELPQLLNVLLGDMSLVGPRPCLPEEARAAGTVVDFRFSVPQGLTGPWQTNGHHGLSFDEQLSVEAAYINGWSVWRDIKILIKTVPLIVWRTGI